MSKLISVFVLILCSLVVQAQSISITPYFNTPGFGRGETTILKDQILRTISEAAPGSQIRLAMYIFSDSDYAKALVLASERGVDVALVLDGRNKNHKQGDAIDILLNGYENHQGLQKCSDEPCLKFCHGPFEFLHINRRQIGGSCNGLVVNHNKFALFSELSDGSRNVVFQSSANFEESHLHRYNDLVEVRNDEALYTGYMNYWRDLHHNHFRLTSPGDFTGESGIRVHTSPRLFGADPVRHLLRRVSCQLPDSSIHLSESDLGRVGVAKELKRLKGEGCRVEVFALYNPRLRQPGKKVKKYLGDSLVMSPESWSDGRNSIHTKIILIDAALDQDNHRSQVVLTGSQNLDLYSLRGNDDCQMEIHDPKVYSQYLEFWEKIMADARASGLMTSL